MAKDPAIKAAEDLLVKQGVLKKDAADLAKKLVDATKKAAKGMDALGASTKKTSEGFVTTSKEAKKAKDSYDQAAGSLKGYVKNGLMSAKSAIKYQGKLNKLQKDYNKEYKSFIDKKRGARATGKKDYRDELQSVEKLQGKHEEIQKLQRDASKEAEKAADKKSGASFTRKSGVASDIIADPNVFGKVAKGASALTGLLPPVAQGALMIAKAVWDAGMAADEFVKNANKAFSHIRGPDIMTTDLKQQFKEFNDQVYDMGKNLAVGLNAGQIREFLGAVNQAGLNISRVTDGLGDYRAAITMAAKASAALGVSLPEVGSYMADLMNNFRMDMGKIDDAFVEVAFDAKKSGLTTQSFMASVEGASSSMAFYGVRLKSASGILRDWTKNMVGGAKDSEKALQDMFSIFKSGTNMETQAVVADFAKKAGVPLEKFFGEAASKAGDEVTALADKINVAKKQYKEAGTQNEKDRAADELEKLNAQMTQQQSMQKRFGAAAKGDAVTMTSEMGALSDHAEEIVNGALRTALNVQDLSKITAKDYAVARKVAGTMGISEDLLRTMVSFAQGQKDALDNMASDISKASDKDLKSLGDNISSTIKDNNSAETNQKAMEPLITEMTTKLFNGDASRARSLGNILLKNNKTSKELLADMKKGDKIATMNLLQSSDMVNATTDGQSENLNSLNSLKDKAGKTFKQTVKQTLSFKEMQDIASDSANYNTYSLGFLQGINEAAFDILKAITKGAPSPSEVKANADLNALAKDSKDFQKYSGSKGVTSEGKTKMAEATTGIDDLVDKIDRATKANAPKNDIKNLQDQLKTLTDMRDLLSKVAPDLVNVQDGVQALKEATVKGNKDAIDAAKDSLRKTLMGIKSTGDVTGVGVSTDDLVNLGVLKPSEQMDIESSNSSMEGMATLNKPQIVQSKGPVTLDPGESILPREMSTFRSIPALGDFGPAGNGAAAGGGKTINVVFNANGLTPRDFAEKVKNEIRAAMYTV